MIASDAGDRKLECSDIDKNFAAVVAQVAIFVVGELSIIVAGVLACRENVDHFLWPHWHRGMQHQLLMRAKMAELTPMASARVNTAMVVNAGDLRSCRRANLKSWIMESLFSLEMQVATGLDSGIVELLKLLHC